MKSDSAAFIILTPGFPANEEDSTCLPMQQALLRSIKKNCTGLNIFILSFQYPFFSKKYKWHNIDVTSFNGRNKGGIRRLITWRKVINNLNALHKQYKIIGVLSFWCGECSYINKQFSRKLNIPHYFWLMGQDAKKENRYINRIKPEPDELIALSDFLQEEFNRNYTISPAHVISPGVDTTINFDSKGKKDIDILGSGSLIPLKQFNLFIEIIYEIKKSIPGITAMICGKGPDEENLLKQISLLRMENNITLTGEMPHEELIKAMQRSRILLHPSSYEGFSGVCLEALQAGADVISFCKPMNTQIANWHIENSKESMKTKAIEILQSKKESYHAVIYKSIDDTANEVMKLFGY